MHNISIRDAMRQSHVTRWGMVQTSRKQTLAEHCCNVAMLVMEICYREKLSDIRTDQLVRLAITHDMAEVYTGDVATPLKHALGSGYFVDLDCKLSFAGMPIACDDEEAARILKIADIVDALLFVTEYGQGEHSRSVGQRLYDALMEVGGVAAVALFVDATAGKYSVLSDIK